MKKFLILLVLALLSVSVWAVDTYTLAVDEWVPYSYEENEVQKGMDVDVLNAVAAKVGIKFNFVFVPWNRVLAMARNGEADGILSLYNTEERRSYLKYPETYLNNETIVLVYKNLKVVPKTLTDLKGLTIGVAPNTSYGDAFDDYKDIKREESIDGAVALKKLMADRMDAIVINKFNFLNEPQYDIYRDKLKIAPFIVNDEKLFVAFSLEALKKKSIPIDKISKALAELRKDGTIDKIYEKYLNKK